MAERGDARGLDRELNSAQWPSSCSFDIHSLGNFPLSVYITGSTQCTLNLK